MTSLSAIKLFLQKERKQLFGRYYLNLMMLIGVFLIAIISIGFSMASTAYLQKKMSDPFVTCVDITVRQRNSKGIECLREFIENPDHQKKFAYRHPEQQYFLQHKFYSAEDRPVSLDGLSFQVESPMDTAVLSANNIIRSRLQPLEDDEFGIILSQSALKKLRLTDEITVLRQHYETSLDAEGSFAVPILAIVRELPYQCDFFATKAYAMHDTYDEADYFAVNNLSYANRLYVLFPEDEEIDGISSRFDEIWQDGEEMPYFIPWQSNYILYTYRTNAENRVRLFDSIYSEIQKEHPQSIRAFNFDQCVVGKDWIPQKPELYLCYFEANDSLQYKVEAFKNQLEKDVNYKLDMSKINNLKNLAHIQQMGKTLSFSIVAIAIIFIMVFIYFLLSMHFRKIQRNLGTFKAFGVSNLTLVGIYLLIMLEMILIAFACAFGIAMIIESLVNAHMPQEGMYERLMNMNCRNVILLILSISIAIASTLLVAYRILRHTPGDLIYNRT